ncbi:hypothetical protein ACLOJK_040055 [Asimina triloba]
MTLSTQEIFPRDFISSHRGDVISLCFPLPRKVPYSAMHSDSLPKPLGSEEIAATEQEFQQRYLIFLAVMIAEQQQRQMDVRRKTKEIRDEVGRGGDNTVSELGPTQKPESEMSGITEQRLELNRPNYNKHIPHLPSVYLVLCEGPLMTKTSTYREEFV